MASTRQPTQGTFSNSDVDSSEDVLILGVVGHETLWVTFVVGVANLSAFTVEYSMAPDASQYVTVASVAADYTAPEGPILGSSGDLTTAAFGSTVHFLKLDVQGTHFVRLKAAGTSSTVTGYYGLN